ncbi:1-deoxy-D-xylulose-5-phosphate reductoisomerase [Grimontia hollisae]|nr:1-deoxy-D-xylulose-5-phosphate reductoisomerase [Grimontia hollisae]AMG30010.1 1-deoxy-D-xylulose-5-phosphate reductoisomerase [Grimontia hollisae]MDF2183677.1 1-deoxy-D-xylulose-5-phosphate reductoisomerase [Grimontia hollisae]STO42860.1 1-deoxy-D-xylulose 5-phosphate reductoisomerase [Grimontia hollisae]STO56638.1 1-deoxy-D-xylulose 5-phosphate reductoisomerase [Grimontia hollisae]STQ77310.1 1-deoxy-D-xylulose 5-phosphate reductoisomerase [Grimontia hollisae]
MRKITILGATGSIGTSTLSVIEKNLHAYEVFALAANANVNDMILLCLKWRPKFAAMANPDAADALRLALRNQGCSTDVLSGIEGLSTLAAHDEVDTVMAAVVGAAGLLPTMAAVKAGKRILLANKEALVMSGQFFIDAVHRYGAELLPVDSEHNAIFQCLPQRIQSQPGICDLSAEGVSKILLTGSGGPFRYTDLDVLPSVTPAQAIDHPNWSMGPKISVDSATMMNKGLEYIEARWLFNAQREQLDVIIHPQSVIHSMVQYRDGSVLAQMGRPDMCTPIAYAMAYPARIEAGVKPLDFSEVGELTFLKPDFNRYPCLKLAIDACYVGQAATTTLNAANEVAVDAFLQQHIGFMQIAEVNDAVLQRAELSEPSCLESLLEIDDKARAIARQTITELME